MRASRKALIGAVSGTAVGAIGLGLLAMPATAGGAPELPDVSAPELVSSVLTADMPALAGTVEVENNLGLPDIPGQQSMLGTESARVYTDGKQGARVSFEQDTGEQIAVSNGNKAWFWDAASQRVTEYSLHEKQRKPKDATKDNPAELARSLVDKLNETSEVRVDGTARVADRAAYDLVLTPKPTERTLLREVRVAVDAETRLPLRLAAFANGSTEPVAQLSFTDLTIGAQPADLFTFTPPAGAEVVRPEPNKQRDRKPGEQEAAMADSSVIGDGWDTALVLRGKELLNSMGMADQGRPDQDKPDQSGVGPGAEADARQMLEQVGEKVTGSFGSGRLISTNVGGALITDDGRIAVGAVPKQVLIEALEQAK
ncbi:outer membrane lipoprotein-sorting protein [Tamaricihabitans halophyticus]|uniref:Outer membrane lipoprotein-sorting protein n=1 Tax=Tamaricihabitans halophyticus TaxID=1262583 RepID=A0A4V2SUY2_9PSEU|nr:sigma-E factor regulatory protein RseB domain-containing protein [Tamaricihabitans halophyticus]TCP56256.1 outer membrane lipoprotein-sorting protein [Tamaricihabitans halophyticus]